MKVTKNLNQFLVRKWVLLIRFPALYVNFFLKLVNFSVFVHRICSNCLLTMFSLSKKIHYHDFLTSRFRAMSG